MTTIKLPIDSTKTYLLAVSGGIDSMVMADLFLKSKTSFAVAHCNFSLRGEESDLDEMLVQTWCVEHKIRFHHTTFDTGKFANDQKLSIQEAARNLRYAYFSELQQQFHYDLVATAHHERDQVETVLFHFMRGTGLQGLTGIPESNHHIIRPLLHTTKQAIIEYAIANKIPYRDDSSNQKDNYTRNKIRNNLLPFLEELFPNAEQNIANTITRLHEANSIYLQTIKRIQHKLIEKRGTDFYIPILKLKHLTPLSTITYELIKPFGFNFEQALQLIKLIESQTGSLLQNEQYQIIRNRNFFIITPLQLAESEFVLIDQDQHFANCHDLKLQFSTHLKTSNEIHTLTDTEQVDADLIKYPLILRKWRQGDYLYPLGMPKKKKVARVLIDAKISLPDKEKIWVLESDKKIVCIPGIKLDHRFRIQPKTSQVLHIHWTKNYEL